MNSEEEDMKRKFIEINKSIEKLISYMSVKNISSE